MAQHVMQSWLGCIATAGLPGNTRVLHQRESAAVVPEFRKACHQCGDMTHPLSMRAAQIFAQTVQGRLGQDQYDVSRRVKGWQSGKTDNFISRQPAHEPTAVHPCLMAGKYIKARAATRPRTRCAVYMAGMAHEPKPPQQRKNKRYKQFRKRVYKMLLFTVKPKYPHETDLEDIYDMEFLKPCTLGEFVTEVMNDCKYLHGIIRVNGIRRIIYMNRSILGDKKLSEEEKQKVVVCGTFNDCIIYGEYDVITKERENDGQRAK